MTHITRTVFATTALLVLVGLGTTRAQPLLFGSLDDPLEEPRRAWWLKQRHVEPLAGLSLIGAQWRSASRLRARLEGRTTAIEIDAGLRAGIYGRYGPDSDEPYDAARAVRFARVRRGESYLRVGPPTRTRLGTGLLMDFYNGTAAWDERRVGVEATVVYPRARLTGMASDLRLDRLIGARTEIRPFGGRLKSVRLAVGLVTDRSLDGEPLVAREASLRFQAASSGAFILEPFAGIGEIEGNGRGLMLGADLGAANFIDLATLHARLAVQYAENRFRPGFFGSFYEVAGPEATILGVDATSPLPSLGETTSGTYIVSELRLHFFERFEFWYSFRRHYGAQALSDFHLRLFVRMRRLLFAYGEDRGGLRGFFSLFNDVGDLSVMSFRTDYRLAGPLWLRVDARYGYVRLEPTRDVRQYAVQRRFEPLIGLRVNL